MWLLLSVVAVVVVVDVVGGARFFCAVFFVQLHAKEKGAEAKTEIAMTEIQSRHLRELHCTIIR